VFFSFRDSIARRFPSPVVNCAFMPVPGMSDNLSPSYSLPPAVSFSPLFFTTPGEGRVLLQCLSPCRGQLSFALTPLPSPFLGPLITSSFGPASQKLPSSVFSALSSARPLLIHSAPFSRMDTLSCPRPAFFNLSTHNGYFPSFQNPIESLQFFLNHPTFLPATETPPSLKVKWTAAPRNFFLPTAVSPLLPFS